MDILKNIKHSDIEYFSLQGQELKGKVVNIYDGDTCSIVLMMNDGTLQKHKVRLFGFDCPELVPPKSKENRQEIILSAKRSRNYLAHRVSNVHIDINEDYSKKELQRLLDLNTKIIKVQCLESDKYGRLLAKIYDGKKCINDEVVQNGYGYEYYGGTKN